MRLGRIHPLGQISIGGIKRGGHQLDDGLAVGGVRLDRVAQFHRAEPLLVFQQPRLHVSSQSMRLYIIRHADPDYERDNLTPAGHLEAAALAERMEKITPTHIYSSPLGRAKATMQYSADRLKMQPVIQEWMAELADCRLTLEPWGRLVMWDV